MEKEIRGLNNRIKGHNHETQKLKRSLTFEKLIVR
jgi:hypothetical protein